MQENIYREIVQHTPDAILFADREGIIRLWNAGAEAMFGFPAAEAIGQPLDLIIPERLRPRHNEGYDRVMGGGETRYGRELLAVPMLHRQGHQLSGEFSISLVRGERGEVLGVAAILRDITLRRQQEKELKELKERFAALETAGC